MNRISNLSAVADAPDLAMLPELVGAYFEARTEARYWLSGEGRPADYDMADWPIDRCQELVKRIGRIMDDAGARAVRVGDKVLITADSMPGHRRLDIHPAEWFDGMPSV